MTNSRRISGGQVPDRDPAVEKHWSTQSESDGLPERGNHSGKPCDSVAFNENDNEDLKFTQYGTHD